MNAIVQQRQMAPVVVIGAGVIGAAIAFSLQRRGIRTVLIDKDEPGRGASFGNMASIAVTEFMPVSRPGIWAKIPGWLLDPEGPIRIRPAHAPRLMPWFLRFIRAGLPPRLRQLEDAGAALTSRVYEDMTPLLDQADLQHLLSSTGCLCLYANDAELAADREHLDVIRRYGFEHTVLDREELLKLEPAIGEHIRHAVLLPDSRTIQDPLRLTLGLVDRFLALGGEIRRGQVRNFETGSGTVDRLILADGSEIAASQIVLCCGAYTGELSKLLGEAIPLETERGYHVQLSDPGIGLNHSIIVPAQAFMICPIAGGIRVGGTIELAGLDAPPDFRRSSILVKRAAALLPDLQSTTRSDWMGHRPALPDTIPVISQSGKWRNCYYATGHGHLGVTLAATTARLVVDLMTGRRPPIDLTPYRVDRFH